MGVLNIIVEFFTAAFDGRAGRFMAEPEVRDDALVWLLGQVQASDLRRWFETDSGQVAFERWRDVLRKWIRQGHPWNAQGIFESSLGFRDVNVDLRAQYPADNYPFFCSHELFEIPLVA
jgi:hypothetical protein